MQVANNNREHAIRSSTSSMVAAHYETHSHKLKGHTFMQYPSTRTCSLTSCDEASRTACLEYAECSFFASIKRIRQVTRPRWQSCYAQTNKCKTATYHKTNTNYATSVRRQTTIRQTQVEPAADAAKLLLPRKGHQPIHFPLLGLRRAADVTVRVGDPALQ